MGLRLTAGHAYCLSGCRIRCVGQTGEERNEVVSTMPITHPLVELRFSGHRRYGATLSACPPKENNINVLRPNRTLRCNSSAGGRLTPNRYLGDWHGPPLHFPFWLLFRYACGNRCIQRNVYRLTSIGARYRRRTCKGYAFDQFLSLRLKRGVLG